MVLTNANEGNEGHLPTQLAESTKESRADASREVEHNACVASLGVYKGPN